MKKIIILIFAFTCTKIQAFTIYPKNEIKGNSDTCVLVNRSNKDITFFEHNDFAWGNFGFLKAKNTLSLKVGIGRIIVTPDKYQYPFLLYPNDTINCLTNSEEELELLASSPLRTFELNYFKKLQKQTSPLSYFGRPKTGVSNDIIFHENAYNKRLEILTNDFAKKNISQRFFNDAIVILKSYQIENIFIFCKKNINDQFVLSKKASFFDTSFSDLTIYKIALIKSGSFLITDIFNKKGILRLNNLYGNHAADFILSKRVYDSLRMNKKISIIAYDIYLQSCKNQDLKKQIEELYNSFQLPKSINTKGTFAANLTKQTINLDSLLQNNTDKVYFIDFWASWCVPCRREFPFENELIKKITNKKIEFLFISTDEINDDWLKAVESEKLGGYKNNYRILNSTTSGLLKQLKFATIPRYVIVGEKGKIIDGDALRPSNKKLLIKLNNL